MDKTPPPHADKRPDTTELSDGALEQASGGLLDVHIPKIDTNIKLGDGSVRVTTIADGTSNTIFK